MPQAHDQRSARLLSNIYPVAVLVSGVIVASLLPQSWGTQRGPLSWLTSSVSYVVPSIAKYSAASAFPGVTATYLAILWALLPLLVWASKQMLDAQIGPAAGRALVAPGRSSRTNAWVLLVVGVALFGLMVVIPFVGLSISPRAMTGTTLGAAGWRAFSESRVWLGLLGALMVWVCSVGIAMLLRVLTMCCTRAAGGEQ